MYKSYTIKAFKFKEISGGKGTISYHLVDEIGQTRTVTAKAKAGFIKKIKSVEAIHHREIPLVEALANSSINDIISIDFSDFNRKFPRVHQNSRQEKMARGTIKEIAGAQSINSLNGFDGARLFQLFTIGVVATAIIVFLKNV